MLSIKLPKTAVGLFLLLFTGASLALPATAQSPGDAADGYTSTQPDDDTLSPDDDDPLDRPATSDDSTALDDDRIDDADMTDEERRCAADFPGFDPTSGTYLNDSDERERCPYLL